MKSPFLKTETSSATSLTSSSLWEIKIIVFPSCLRALIVFNKSFISITDSVAVGSSNTIKSFEIQKNF